jgi:hypothetical protein
MSAKTPARSLSNRRGLASRWDACFFMMSFGGVATLNHRLVSFDAYGISARAVTTQSIFPKVSSAFGSTQPGAKSPPDSPQ